MKWIQSRAIFLLLILLGLLTLGISVWDIVYDKGWRQQIFAGYMILILLALVLLVIKPEEKPTDIVDNSVKEFERSLKGKLYHFQCPNCHGIFAIKKSKQNTKKPVKLTCPDCGMIGKIPSKPKSVKTKIPEQKSLNVTFKCNNCGERVTVWAEGIELHQDTYVYSCPYCGEEQSMNRI